jgi:excisionase family DNA binding protein
MARLLWIVTMTTQTLSQIVGRTRELLDEKQAAEHLTVSPGTLSVWRSTGRYNLPFVKVGRMVRYRLSDLDAWLDARARETGATA